MMETIAVKERPILFSGPMVKAILDGRKTQTRRVFANQPVLVNPKGEGRWAWSAKGTPSDDNWQVSWWGHPNGMADYCPHGLVGERLWVREQLSQKSNRDFSNSPHTASSDWVYAVDGVPIVPNYLEMTGWSVHRSKPSIHMPRWASRITLEITDVRVQRLNEISGEDVLAEGVDNGSSNPTMGVRWGNMQKMAFAELWTSINGEGSWAANPWVWAISFKRI